ncbi:mitochondrial 2-enoyl thioester reductase [Elasticomyces elasticus]|uniref:enoyl-[acyl-carrier-protein] reductase n=1 Tax=Exophiala sideris TaxID=1016849 RepID=A0ABR0J9C5_9EURO|nr:mitochondrial 2-enoyl thioester reductase [Elasticomyces elasticus]KAK5027768.1 mitochondrial 2-enoyl thioester reductase [Exophiala sideris]KAK5037642.1 mitochondrial 2-enoyl thioester reductase [Exophiala sideris]KAK5059304.1 mitochondrial 2-enoyl thioester reductase [Exophiala sideris]KAK5183138.1 mitochondrial 2-enoyl thioester reductase [Eurotiomycetes sp. CCFEE 6388]
MATSPLKAASRSLLAQSWRLLCRNKLRSSACDRSRAISSYGYTQAKALVYSKYGEPKDVLSIHGHSISPAAGSSVVVRMLVAPINPADVNQIQGVYPAKPEMNTALGTSEAAAVAGNEGVGEVISTGSGVKSLSKGDWVIMKSTGQGTWRTHMAVDESQLLKIDNKEGLTPLQVGTVSVNPCTAYRMLLDSAKWNFMGDEWFIQNGANSGVGRAAIQLGKEWGFKSINVIRGRENKEEEQKLKQDLLDIGATKVITEEELMSREIKDQIKEWTHGGREQIKVGLNCVGGKPATALAKFLSPGATMVTYGAMSKQPLAHPASLLIFKDISFTGFWVSKWSDRNPEQKKQTVDDVLRLTRARKFKDIPVQECKWGWETEVDTLKAAVQGTLGGFRPGKGVFVFEET